MPVNIAVRLPTPSLRRFGGMNREFIAVVNNRVTRDSAAWNKHCTVPLTDHANLRHVVK